MSAPQLPRVSSGWLELRESADAAARSASLVGVARNHLAGMRATAGARLVIHDLGCGTGSMSRWLAPQLPGPQHWIMYDRDAGLLTSAAAAVPPRASDGAEVIVETRQRDVTRLAGDDLRGGLVTASALLDLLTWDEIERIAVACQRARRMTLLTLSVVGRVELHPANSLDADITRAFNAHQRRTVGTRTLLGPDAADAAAELFARHGGTVTREPSPWRLGPESGDLLACWFAGWVGAAVEQDPDLAVAVAAYTRRRMVELAAGELHVLVHHDDLFTHYE